MSVPNQNHVHNLRIAISVLVASVILIVGVVLVSRYQATRGTPFQRRIQASTDCAALDNEWQTNMTAFQVTGRADFSSAAAYIHAREVAIGC